MFPVLPFVLSPSFKFQLCAEHLSRGGFSLSPPLSPSLSLFVSLSPYLFVALSLQLPLSLSTMELDPQTREKAKDILQITCFLSLAGSLFVILSSLISKETRQFPASIPMYLPLSHTHMLQEVLSRCPCFAFPRRLASRLAYGHVCCWKLSPLPLLLRAQVGLYQRVLHALHLGGGDFLRGWTSARSRLQPPSCRPAILHCVADLVVVGVIHHLASFSHLQRSVEIHSGKLVVFSW